MCAGFEPRPPVAADFKSALQDQQLPSEEHWERAIALLPVLLPGVKAPRVLNAANVSRLAADVRDKATSYRDCGILVDRMLELMKALDVADPRETPRLRTARATRDFIDLFNEQDGVKLISRIAQARIETSEVNMQKSLETSSRNGQALRTFQAELLDGLRRLQDDRKSEAEAILHRLREALEQDEFGVRLEPALQQAATAAVRLLSKVVSPVPPAESPPPVSPPPPPRPTPSEHRMKLLTQGEEKGLPIREARSKLQGLLDQLPQDGEVNLSWTVWRKEG